MPEKTRIRKGVELRPFYQKDMQRLRESVAPYFPGRTMAEWRALVAEKKKRGEQLFYLVRDDQPLGCLDLLAPFGSRTWRLVRIHAIEDLDRQDFIDIAGQVCEEDPMIYRVDLLYCRLTLKNAKIFGTVAGINWPDERLTVFAPETREDKIMFIPWPFGFLAVTLNPDQTAVEAIDFFREKGEDLCLPVLQAAYYQGYTDHEGKLNQPETKEEDSPLAARIREELAAYLEGGHEISLPYRFPEGTPFQKKVWEETLKIPYGTVKTYQDIARALEPDPEKGGRLARAVGGALGANPLPIIIPCHRVIGANRDLTGFGGGVDIKDYLLRIEMWQPASD